LLLIDLGWVCAGSQTFDTYMRDTTLKLNRKVEDLEDVRFVMAVLKEVRMTPSSNPVR
jgi:hypothetical protein